MQIEEQLRERVEDIIIKSGFIIFDLKLIGSYPLKTLRVLIDAPDGGVTIKECADINRKLNSLFEETDFLAERYIAEVSSPGVDWPLKTRKDFQRILSRNVHLYLKQASGTPEQIDGVLREVRDDALFLDVAGESVEIKLDNIVNTKARFDK